MPSNAPSKRRKLGALLPMACAAPPADRRPTHLHHVATPPNCATPPRPAPRDPVRPPLRVRHRAGPTRAVPHPPAATHSKASAARPTPPDPPPARTTLTRRPPSPHLRNRAPLIRGHQPSPGRQPPRLRRHATVRESLDWQRLKPNKSTTLPIHNFVRSLLACPPRGAKRWGPRDRRLEWGHRRPWDCLRAWHRRNPSPMGSP